MHVNIGIQHVNVVIRRLYDLPRSTVKGVPRHKVFSLSIIAMLTRPLQYALLVSFTIGCIVFIYLSRPYLKQSLHINALG